MRSNSVSTAQRSEGAYRSLSKSPRWLKSPLEHHHSELAPVGVIGRLSLRSVSLDIVYSLAYLEGMRRSVPPLLTASIVVSGALGLWGLDRQMTSVGATFKPLTTLLLFLVLGKADIPLRRKLRWGLAFCVLGDIALLGKSPVAFQCGLAAFLVTHLFYIAAFRSFAVASSRAWMSVVFGVTVGGAVVYLAFPQASARGVAGPVVVYSVILTAMMVTLSAAARGPLRNGTAAAVGAVLFYLADVSIALEVFVPWLRIPHPVLFTTGLYWIGQYEIMKAGRAGVKDVAMMRDR